MEASALALRLCPCFVEILDDEPVETGTEILFYGLA